MSRVSEKLIVSYEYKRQEPATRRGLAPSVLIFQTSPSCNIFTKIPNFLRNRCQPSHKGLIFGRFSANFTRILEKSMPALAQRAGTKN